MELHKAKQALRKDIASLKSTYTKTILQTWSANICLLLEKHRLFQQVSCVALYYALPGEVETASLLEKWYQQKKLVLPLVKGNDLQFQQYLGKDALQKGAFNIWEPDETCPIVGLQEIELIIVPGVAFDRSRNRLGRGKGFYDRILTQLEIPKIGICFDFQLKEHIPTEAFDEKMDVILTETTAIE